MLFTVAGVAAVWFGNKAFAPEMYDRSGPRAFAVAFEKGMNFATFDLNINIREMRDEHIARFPKAPEVAVLGASHWQEAHPELLKGVDLYNAHVHRDYYEDMLAMVEMFMRHDKMPKKMIIAIRDRLFTPVADRTDFLWLPGIPYYEKMARFLGLSPHPYWETAPVQRWRELTSTSLLYSNMKRWYKAARKPYATYADHHETLDTLRPGGSIYWSSQHNALFTRKRARRLATEFAEANFHSPPKVDPKGVEAIDTLLAFLKRRGIDVYLVHPPFNPIYYNRILGGAYHVGLRRIEQLTQKLATKHGFKVFGSFNPHKYGCTSDMYIDAEHANPECLGQLFKEFAQISGLDSSKEKSANPERLVSNLQPAKSSDQVIPPGAIKLEGQLNSSASSHMRVRNSRLTYALASVEWNRGIVTAAQRLPHPRSLITYTSDQPEQPGTARQQEQALPRHALPARKPVRVRTKRPRRLRRSRSIRRTARRPKPRVRTKPVVQTEKRATAATKAPAQAEAKPAITPTSLFRVEDAG